MNARCYFVLLTILILSFGCSNRTETVKGASRGVFPEITKETTPSAGYADLFITGSIKTPKAGAYLIDASGRGTEQYILLINVDGQSVEVVGQMQEEATDYTGRSDPEAGSGIRYHFSKNLRLRPGTHTITVTLPDERVTSRKTVDLKEGENRLEISPTYRKRHPKRMIGFRGERTFFEGVKSLQLTEK